MRFFELANELARHANRLRQSGPPRLGRSRRERDVDARHQDEEQLRERLRRRDRTLVDHHDPAEHCRKAERREKCEGERAAKRRLGLIGDAQQRDEEQPAGLRAGVIDRECPHHHIAKENRKSEIPRRVAAEKNNEERPRYRGVDRDHRADEHPPMHRRAGNEKAIVDVDGDRQEDRTAQTYQRQLDRGQTPRPLAPP